jgi:cytochrome c-type biogenesis protein CcmH/NrfG
VVADDPHQAEAWRLLGEACLLQGRFGEAADG